MARQTVARAKPDGYTLLFGASSEMMLNPALYDRLPYDPVKDFSAVAKLYSNPMVFAVNPKVDVKSIKDLIALVKAKPHQVFYASGAAIFQLTGEMFKQEASVDLVRVPYKGSSAALKDVIAGRVQVLVTSLPSATNYVRAGTLRGLAVTSLQRNEHLPNLPTMQEAGLKGFEVVSWTGLYAPAGTPPVIVDKLNHALAEARKEPLVKQRADKLSVTFESGSPEEAAQAQRKQIALWKKLANQFDIHMSLK